MSLGTGLMGHVHDHTLMLYANFLWPMTFICNSPLAITALDFKENTLLQFVFILFDFIGNFVSENSA